MITHFRHTGIVVRDLEAAISFWRDTLGFRVMNRMDESGSYIDAMMGLTDVSVTTVKLAAPDGNLVELLHFRSHLERSSWMGTPYSTGLTHLAFTVDDIDSECTRLAAAGVTFWSPPQTSPDGSVKVPCCSGPEGLLLELVEVLKT